MTRPSLVCRLFDVHYATTLNTLGSRMPTEYTILFESVYAHAEPIHYSQVLERTWHRAKSPLLRFCSIHTPEI